MKHFGFLSAVVGSPDIQHKPFDGGQLTAFALSFSQPQAKHMHFETDLRTLNLGEDFEAFGKYTYRTAEHCQNSRELSSKS